MKNETTQPSVTEQAIAQIEFTDVKAFESIVAAINGLADKYRGLQITDTASYKIVVSGIAEMRNLRVSVEARRKEKKADILAAGRQIDSGAKQITELLLPIENDLKATKQVEDDRKATIQAEKEKVEQERIETIKTKIANFPPKIGRLPQLLKISAPDIQEMQDTLASIEIDIEDYQEFTPEAIGTKEEKKKLLQEYYIARITADAETAKQKAEAERQEQIRKEQEVQRVEQEQALKKQEEEQKAKQKIEKNRLAKIQEKQEVEAEQLSITQAEIEKQKQALQKEYDRLESEKLERERKEQARLAKIEADRTAKIEAESISRFASSGGVSKKQEKARIEQEAEEKTAREKALAEEKARQEALRPDKETLELYVSAIQKAFVAIEEPLIKTPAGNIVLTQIQANFEKMFNDTLDVIEDM